MMVDKVVYKFMDNSFEKNIVYREANLYPL